MDFPFKPTCIRRALLAAMGIACTTAYPASTDLSDNPLPVTSSVQPNIMFMIDNSGSMATTVPGTSDSRLTVAKDAAITLINGLDKVRVGLFTYNSSSNGGVLREPMGDLDSTKRSTMTTKINALTASTWTPLASTLSDIGHYFAKGYPDTSNLTLHPGQSNQSTATTSAVFNNNTYDVLNGVSDTSNPIQYWCQKSFVILLTDGLPTMDDNNTSSYLQEYYGYCTNAANAANCTGTAGKRYFQLSNVTSGTVTTTPEGYEPASSHPSDYLDDVANALYDIDLRPDLTPSSGTKTTKNNVTTYAIAFADPALATTTLLERAAAYGGGLYLTASDSASLVTAFQKAADDILSKDGAAAAVAVANAHVTNTANKTYVTSYNSGTWTGDLIAYPLNTDTGVADINSPVWKTGCANPNAYVDPLDHNKGILGCSAQVLLDSKSASTRYIFTSNDTSSCRYNCGIPFQPTTATGSSGTDKLSTAQRDRLKSSSSATDGDAVITYLRGDKSGEDAGTYRTRAHLLGDTVNAEPLVISPPEQEYSDAGYLSCTPANCTPFRIAKENRTSIIMQASNDGMVHAFNADTGAEVWAYIPDLLISSTKNSDPSNSSIGILNTRTRKSFTHYSLIDATPVAGDVDFDKANNASGTGSPDWRTIVVGGFGKGGRGYYALDVTNTTATAEGPASTSTSAAAKALWEFPRSIVDSTQRSNAANNIGYTYGKPIITKTKAAGWVVLLTSGYNNGTNSGDSGGDGYGHLYVVNPKTGDLIADLVTTQCRTDVTSSAANSAANPCGLTHINAYVEDRSSNNTAEMVYGGDLYGNVWRFDLTGSTVASWNVTKLAKLRSPPASGTGSTSDDAQPITSVPELSKVTAGASSYYFVYVGTGQYLGKTDLPCPPTGTCAWTPNSQSTQTQSMYGLIDPRDGSTLPDPLRASLLQQTYTTSGSNRTFTNTTMTYTGGQAKKGWVVDFSGGERINTDPALAAGVLVFTTNIPDTTACQPGGSSWIYALNYDNGGQVLNAISGGTKLASALSSRPVLIQLPNGQVKALTRLSDATTLTTSVPATATANAGKRVSWRELLDQ